MTSYPPHDCFNEWLGFRLPPRLGCATPARLVERACITQTLRYLLAGLSRIRAGGHRELPGEEAGASREQPGRPCTQSEQDCSWDVTGQNHDRFSFIFPGSNQANNSVLWSAPLMQAHTRQSSCHYLQACTEQCPDWMALIRWAGTEWLDWLGALSRLALGESLGELPVTLSWNQWSHASPWANPSPWLEVSINLVKILVQTSPTFVLASSNNAHTSHH